MRNIKKIEQALENNFAYEESARFRALSRRSRRLGLWAAERMGLSDHDAYAAELADFFIVTPQEDAMAAKVAQDFAKAGVECSDYDIRLKMVELLFAPQAESLAA